MLYNTYGEIDASRYKHVYVSSGCFTECFATQITAIGTHTSMYMLMNIQATCFTDCFIPHHSDIDVPQYVHITVPSDYFLLLNVLLHISHGYG